MAHEVIGRCSCRLALELGNAFVGPREIADECFFSLFAELKKRLGKLQNAEIWDCGEGRQELHSPWLANVSKKTASTRVFLRTYIAKLISKLLLALLDGRRHACVERLTFLTATTFPSIPSVKRCAAAGRIG